MKNKFFEGFWKAQMKITKDTGIMEIIKKNPKAIEILMKSGMHCVGCMAAHFETIEQGCLAHGMNEKQINKLIKELNKKWKIKNFLFVLQINWGFCQTNEIF